MLPSGLRLNERLAAAGFARKLLMTVVPPLLKGFLWSTSLPSPFLTAPVASSILRALFLCARFFLTASVPS